MSNTAPHKKKIVVLGGGMGSLTAVWELTNQPDWQELYDITVYQMGWRLGGKGASGRNIKPTVRNEAKETEASETDRVAPNYRIEEHGLHIFFGFYKNAFRLLKQAYDESYKLGHSGSDSPFKSVAEAFKPHNYIVLQEYYKERWVPWEMEFPTNNLKPWEGRTVRSLWTHIHTTFQFIKSNWRKVETHLTSNFRLTEESKLKAVEDSLQTIDETLTAIDEKRLPPGSDILLFLINKMNESMQPFYQNEGLLREDDQRRRLIMINFALSNLTGLLEDEILFKGFDSLNEYDYAEWLRRHGALEITLQSPPVRMLYDLVYGFEQGDITKPRFAAGIALRALSKMMFEYDGAIMWKMQAGMGDIVFTPIYQVLKHRGVKFEFFHNVTHLGLSADKKSISNIKMNLQATIKEKKEYVPLIEVKKLGCWPSEPLYAQLEQGEALKKLAHENPFNNPLESFWSTWQPVGEISLRAEEDFDIVILGISIAALPYICPELIAASAKWQNMIDKVQTVTTQGGQIWLNKTLPQLGWVLPSPVLGSYVEPLDTYADMSHLIERENWHSDDNLHSIAYFTGVIADKGTPPPSNSQFPSDRQKEIDQEAITFLKEDIGYLWPISTTEENPQGLDWSLLIDPENRQGEARFNAQYWRININPTERYVMSVPGSIEYRLKADESGFNRLYLTGDWIDNSFNAGAIEPTVMSGMQAARAVLKQEFNIKYNREIIHEGDILL